LRVPRPPIPHPRPPKIEGPPTDKDTSYASLATRIVGDAGFKAADQLRPRDETRFAWWRDSLPVSDRDKECGDPGVCAIRSPSEGSGTLLRRGLHGNRHPNRQAVRGHHRESRTGEGKAVSGDRDRYPYACRLAGLPDPPTTRTPKLAADAIKIAARRESATGREQIDGPVDFHTDSEDCPRHQRPVPASGRLARSPALGRLTRSVAGNNAVAEFVSSRPSRPKLLDRRPWPARGHRPQGCLQNWIEGLAQHPGDDHSHIGPPRPPPTRPPRLP